MKYVIYVVLFTIMLSGCARKPIDLGLAQPVQVPELPKGEFEKVGPLPQITDRTLGAQQIDATQTDIKYNDVSTRYNRLIDFYNCIRVSVNNKEEPKCLL